MEKVSDIFFLRRRKDIANAIVRWINPQIQGNSVIPRHVDSCLFALDGRVFVFEKVVVQDQSSETVTFLLQCFIGGKRLTEQVTYPIGAPELKGLINEVEWRLYQWTQHTFGDKMADLGSWSAEPDI